MRCVFEWGSGAAGEGVLIRFDFYFLPIHAGEVVILPCARESRGHVVRIARLSFEAWDEDLLSSNELVGSAQVDVGCMFKKAVEKYKKFTQLQAVVRF